MPRFRVRPGQVLAHGNEVLQAGAIVELPRAVAEDAYVAGAVEEVNAAGELVAPPAPNDLSRFRVHERVSILEDKLAAAQAVVTSLQEQLDAAKAELLAALKSAAPAKSAKPTPPPSAP